MKQLGELIHCIEPFLVETSPDRDIDGVSIANIVYDSRSAAPGSLFAALRGENTDGHRFIPGAVERGAAAVVGEDEPGDLPVPYLRVTNSRLALAHLAAGFYDHPARRMTMIGVTGTDGKTTTANLIYSILEAAGVKCGLISTVNAVIGNQVVDTGFHVTTPEAPDVQRYLADMCAAGLTHAVVEATSHGLAQHRVACCEFDLGIVTNITHEHLDYHGTPEAYRAAKASLFDLVAGKAEKGDKDLRIAVINRDDESFSYLYEYVQSLPPVRHLPIDLISYGKNPLADVRSEAVQSQTGGVSFTAVVRGQRIPIQSSLTGDYNISNCLAALAAAVGGLGIEAQYASEGIRALQGIPGRMEKIDLGTDFLAIVDFAHTPNALRRVLLAARQVVGTDSEKGRLIAVFGSAGLRDRAKRRMMAETGAELADYVVLTAEDPRIESVKVILDEMAGGCRSRGGVEGKNFWRVPDRREAIRFALTLAQPGDVLLLLGKGHEQSMCFGAVEYPWDDRVALRAALSEYLHVPGPEMPYLPD
jgi:UDP-N-acetylmuramoyl-L-alanyl-D-glutamate--2,6-diaminopimelate ligase